MKKLLLLLFLLLGVFCFSEIKGQVYVNTSNPYSGGTYYLLTLDNRDMFIIYDGYYRADGNPKGIAGRYTSINSGIIKSGNILKSKNSYYSVDNTEAKEKAVGTKFILDKNGLKEEGDNKTYKYIRELNDEDFKLIGTFF